MKWYEQERMNTRIALTVDQRRIAKEMHERAEKIRKASSEVSIADAVHIAAFQMGLQEADRDAVEEPDVDSD